MKKEEEIIVTLKSDLIPPVFSAKQMADMKESVDAILAEMKPGEYFEFKEIGLDDRRARDLVWTYTHKRNGHGFFKVKGGKVWCISRGPEPEKL